MDRRRILLVDDDDAMRTTLVRILRRRYVVTDVNSVAKAVGLLSSGTSFVVVVSDFEMPGERGDVLYTWVEAHRPELASRIIILSGGSADQTGTRWLVALGPERVLSKPCSLEALIAAIERVASAG
jgi:CheY-like chemotaxis protein